MARRPETCDGGGGTESSIIARFRSAGGRTITDRLAEKGSLRLRQTQGAAYHGVIVNTAGGVVEGDRLLLDISLDESASVALTSAGAEKIYRSTGRASFVTTRFEVGNGARLLSIPHETILFDHGSLSRRFTVDLTEHANFLAVEMVQFGRTASGEIDVTGSMHESWRIRREGRLVFADETRLEGPIGAILDRRAVANGGRAVATLVLASPVAESQLEPLRDGLAATRLKATDPRVEAGASLRNGIIVARLVAPSSELLRAMVAGAVEALDGFSLPRFWL